MQYKERRAGKRDSAGVLWMLAQTLELSWFNYLDWRYYFGPVKGFPEIASSQHQVTTSYVLEITAITVVYVFQFRGSLLTREVSSIPEFNNRMEGLRIGTVVT